MIPYIKGLPLNPCLTADDPVTYAVKVMLKYDIEQIAVVRKIRPIGMIRIGDALKKLGLDLP